MSDGWAVGADLLALDARRTHDANLPIEIFGVVREELTRELVVSRPRRECGHIPGATARVIEASTSDRGESTHNPTPR